MERSLKVLQHGNIKKFFSKKFAKLNFDLYLDLYGSASEETNHSSFVNISPRVVNGTYIEWKGLVSQLNLPLYVPFRKRLATHHFMTLQFSFVLLVEKNSLLHL